MGNVLDRLARPARHRVCGSGPPRGADRARLIAMLAKAEASHDGLLRGQDKPGPAVHRRQRRAVAGVAAGK